MAEHSLTSRCLNVGTQQRHLSVHDRLGTCVHLQRRNRRRRRRITVTSRRRGVLRCRYERFGCTDLFLRKDPRIHELECPFQPLPCPYEDCASLLQPTTKEILDHVTLEHGGCEPVVSEEVCLKMPLDAGVTERIAVAHDRVFKIKCARRVGSIACAALVCAHRSESAKFKTKVEVRGNRELPGIVTEGSVVSTLDKGISEQTSCNFPICAVIDLAQYENGELNVVLDVKILKLSEQSLEETDMSKLSC